MEHKPISTAFLHKLLKWSKTILCLTILLLLISSCEVHNEASQKDGMELKGASTESTSFTADASAKADVSSKADISSGLIKPDEEPVLFPDIERKPRTIENKYGVYYEIFVRSFADSNEDGIGDLKGLSSKLDYLNDGNQATKTDLGIDGIYLMPVNVSPSYHKYDVTDYYDIDPEYGTLEDFSKFLEDAHERGIKVIMDLVINHTSKDHSWFRESAKSPENPYRSYYNWASEGDKGYDVKSVLASGTRVWNRHNGSYYYGYFWEGMPDLNYDSVDVRKEIKKIAQYWLEKGVDGFRLDAAMHIYAINEKPAGTRLRDKNIQWWKEFGAAAEEVNPNVYLVGEVWEKSYAIAPYYEGLDTLFNFDAGEGIISIIQSGSVMAVGSKGFAPWLKERHDNFAKAEPNYLDAPFLTNHDQNRIMDRLKGDIGKAKLAAAIYLTLPGNPFIYYGEEIGMKGMKPDEKIRVPFIWFKERKAPQCTWESILNNADTVAEEVQRNDPDSLLNYYKRLIHVRQSSEALVKGDFEPMDAGNRAVLAFARNITAEEKEAERVIVLHNISNETHKITLAEEFSNAVILFDSTHHVEGSRNSRLAGFELELSPKLTIIIRNQ